MNLPYEVSTGGLYTAVARDKYPILTSKVEGAYMRRLLRDPMDTPRHIGFLADLETKTETNAQR